MTSIGYLGPKGTFTKMAVDSVFNGEMKNGYRTIPECIDAVDKGEVDIGVVPIENAIEGTVQLTIDYLIHQVRLPVVAEIIVPIQQHLLVRKEVTSTLSDIHEVYSHSHAIAQCHQYLHHHLHSALTKHTSSTGKAAEIVSNSKEPIAAIGNRLAAEEYGLHILQENIHDYPNNHTRFLVLSNYPEKVHIRHKKDSEKTTMLITLPNDQSGALHQILSAFSWRKLNLSKIESRPTKTGLGNYFFIIDVDQPYDDILFPGVKSELEALGCQVTILGTYPVYHMLQH
ncbi:MULTISPECIES: prephenate dehydratase [Oceanobacillus]|uniref:Prephenate dehydratase n=1 Tax=Oceanobacillus kimchii TaxID=746691 RepID=A0ABQ5TIK2_9BACI|nr:MULTISPECIES: prephenate dehydratase [Oceanobacillus]MBT2598205.1 prephenate dehydratase [Oceanobacillus sp. ISL-74]MBT2651124.1 prephenate dehydratase [Oceanobacillus sp. ISL-73]GLO66699.1 prephenate dehydratase [Oceanobacillus kimchii]